MSAQALKPPFTYYGGKTTIAPKIAGLLPSHEHYIEPFAGSLAVLLAKPRSKIETVNDLDEDLMTFWRVLREQPEELERHARLTPYSRKELNNASQELSHLDDMERARRVWVRLSQGRRNSMSRNQGWRSAKAAGVGMSRPTYLETFANRFEAVAERIAGVTLESMDAIEMIQYYGGDPSVCIYADPPYLGSIRSTGYEVEMLENDMHVKLADVLNKCEASIVLSGYASSLYEELYKGWHRMEMKAPPNLSSKKSPNEVLWSNVPLGDQTSLF